MPRSIAVASGTAGVQAATGAATLAGYSVRESAGSPLAATVILRNGTSAAGAAVAFIEIGADASQTVTLPAIDCPNGIFVDRVAGTSEIAIFVL
jgi:hypothetical protein